MENLCNKCFEYPALFIANDQLLCVQCMYINRISQLNMYIGYLQEQIHIMNNLTTQMHLAYEVGLFEEQVKRMSAESKLPRITKAEIKEAKKLTKKHRNKILSDLSPINKKYFTKLFRVADKRSKL